MLTATLLERGEIVNRTFRNGNDLWLYQQQTVCTVIAYKGTEEPSEVVSTVDSNDSATWTILEDPLPSGRQIVTSWSPQRFSSGWGIGGDPLHFQTVTVEADGSLGASWEYACESEARAGHHRIVTDLRLQERR